MEKNYFDKSEDLTISPDIDKIIIPIKVKFEENKGIEIEIGKSHLTWKGESYFLKTIEWDHIKDAIIYIYSTTFRFRINSDEKKLRFKLTNKGRIEVRETTSDYGGSYRLTNEEIDTFYEE